jgi:hypothetical protein
MPLETMFARLCNDQIHIEKPNGTLAGPHRCVIAKNKVSVFDETLHVSTSDKLLRSLPNGTAEKYDVIDVQFTAQFHQIPGHFDLTVHRHGAPVPFRAGKVTNISISNSHAFQIGDHNVQQIVSSLQYLISTIEKSGSPAEQAEAKGRLKKFLEHPLTSAVLGAGVESLFGRL